MKRATFLTLALLLTVVSLRAQLLWKVTGNGLAKPSYLMGTYHMAKPSFADSVPGLRKALDECEQVCGEIDMASAMNDTQSLQALQAAMQLPGDSTLEQILTAEQYSRLNKMLSEVIGADLTNPALAELKRLTPAALSAQMEMFLAVAEEQDYNPQEQLDLYFQQVAHSQGKPVKGLETMEQQTKILFGSATRERQIEKLMCTVDNPAYARHTVQRVIQAFYAQDLKTLETAINEKQHNSCDDTPQEQEALISGRNADWMNQLPAIMHDKSTFIAVGVGHLVGERGLLQQLRDAGYTLTPAQ